MKLSLGLVGAMAALLAIAACADSEPPAAGPDDPDAGGLPHSDGGPTADASSDADAAPRECSDHGFCHTVVPKGHVLRGVWGDGTGVVWAVSEKGAVLRWDGKAWNLHATDLGPLHAIWGSSATDLWIGGDKGLRHGTGASAQTIAFVEVAHPDGTPFEVRSIWGTSASNVWAAGKLTDTGEGQVLALDAGDAAPSWKVAPVTRERVAFAHVWGSDATGVWVAGARPQVDEPLFEEIAVFRKKAGATSFAEVPLPLDPDDAPVFAKLSVFGGAAAGGTSVMWIFGRSVSAVPGIWKGTSTDGGDTFTFEYQRNGKNDEPQINAVFARAPNDAWAVGEYGRVRRWNGDAWAPAAITVGKLPVVDPFFGVFSAAPNDVWVVGDEIAIHKVP